MQQDQSPPKVAAGMPSGLQHSSAALGRLLVIDDDLSVSTLICKFGERAGFSATPAVSIEEATRLLRSEVFDCITLDLNMGKKNGIEILKVLAGMGSKTPIIVISGSAPSLSELAAAVGNMMQLNLLPPLPKPIDFAKLKAALGAIKQELEQRRHTAPAA